MLLLKQKHPHGDTSVLLKMVCGGEDYRLRNDHKAALGGIQHRDGSWKERKGLMVGLVNAPLGSLPTETSTNISIITEKPSECQAQSPDVADNML